MDYLTHNIFKTEDGRIHADRGTEGDALKFLDLSHCIPVRIAICSAALSVISALSGFYYYDVAKNIEKSADSKRDNGDMVGYLAEDSLGADSEIKSIWAFGGAAITAVISFGVALMAVGNTNDRRGIFVEGVDNLRRDRGNRMLSNKLVGVSYDDEGQRVTEEVGAVRKGIMVEGKKIVSDESYTLKEFRSERSTETCNAIYSTDGDNVVLYVAYSQDNQEKAEIKGLVEKGKPDKGNFAEMFHAYSLMHTLGLPIIAGLTKNHGCSEVRFGGVDKAGNFTEDFRMGAKQYQAQIDGIKSHIEKHCTNGRSMILG